MTLFERAKRVMPGGVNSPVRAFGAVGGEPVFIERGDGPRIYDVGGNEYIDYVCSWGPLILGHNNALIRGAVASAVNRGLSFGAPTEAEVLLAEKMTAFVPGLEMVRMVNSGTEAVMSGIRLARGFTGRRKVIKFEGCYHGHSDGMLVKAGSGALTYAVPDSLGVTEAAAADTLTARYNDLSGVERFFEVHGSDIACVIVEPVAANMGVVPPKDGFLQGLRRICGEHGALLIFDEVITGFRLCGGGAQAYYGVTADLAAYGKIIGGGMPVGAYGGRKDIMEYVAPSGPVYQAGTLAGNPVAMAAGLSQLTQLENPEVYSQINRMGERLQKGLQTITDNLGVKAAVTRVGSLVCLFFGVETADSYEDVKAADREQYGRYFHGMLKRGVYLPPSQFEAMFISYAHREAEIDRTLEAAEGAMKTL